MIRIFVISQIMLYALVGFAALAQVTIVPIQGSRDYREAVMRQQTNARTHGVDSSQLTLPFWDDFSTVTQMPDSAKWMQGSGTAIIAPGIGIDPPTVNVALFDGWNNLGVPYSPEQLAYGAGDSLVSRFIDLDEVEAGKRETVYFSFFWQKEGRGEQPDEPDSLALLFMNKEKEWIRIWSVSGTQVQENNVFFQEIIKVDTAFFDPYFQFRFQSYGRLSGGFDNWNVDYVYMNFDRDLNDLAYPDRALTSIPSSFLNKYTAMPYDHFIEDVGSNLTTVFVDFYNMDSQVQPIEYSTLIRDTLQVYDQMDNLSVLDPNPGGFERRTIESGPVDPGVFDTEHDTLSLMLETVFFINSGDSLLFDDKIDYRVNDTTTSYVYLDRELAYDDGTAEWAAGLSQRGSKIAYRFVIPKPDIITEIKIYYPTFYGGVAGQTFTLVIWDNLREGVEGRLLTEQHIMQPSTALNQFTTYQLGRSVSVQDTFYVGYEQDIPDFVAVGLDKNTDSSGELFFNTDGTWAENENIAGSLMMRPVFGFKKAVGLAEDLVFADFRIYPNPTRGSLYLEGDVQGVTIFDLAGRVMVNIQGQPTDNMIDLGSLMDGVYIFRVQKASLSRTYKVILMK
jgi:hypothetical protein